MDRRTPDPDDISIEERFRMAKAERAIAIGYAIGDALEALWRVIGSLPFAPGAAKKDRGRAPGSVGGFAFERSHKRS
ncbi:MAG TPA: hypothetical protein VII36_07105 [Usitatibacter sp.]